MPITQALCTSFKEELLEAQHNFSSGGDTFNIALYSATADLDATTTNYTATNEVTGAGYTAGGAALTVISPVISGTTVYIDFNDVTFANSSITANGALIYNTTAGTGTNTTNAVAVIAFGADRTSANGDFTIRFPIASVDNAIIRIN